MRHPLIRLPETSIRILDADEEIFLLYSQAVATRRGSAGIGSFDARKDEILLSLDVRPRHQRFRGSSSPRDERSETVEVRLAQDITALRSRLGDTGSVIWRASIEFAKAVMADIFYGTDSAIFDAERLKDIAVLELGSGTGVLGVLLAPYVGSYLVTDLPELVPLMEKNINYNSLERPTAEVSNAAAAARIPPRSLAKSRKPRAKPTAAETKTRSGRVDLTAQPLDWVTIASTIAGSNARAWACSHIRSDVRKNRPNDPSAFDGQTRFDLILAVDTLYNTALISPFLAVLDEFASKGSLTSDGGEDFPPTLVVVVCELRDEDVLREFLEGWLELPGWEIWRVGDTNTDGDGVDDVARTFMQGPFVVWAGWKATEMC